MLIVAFATSVKPWNCGADGRMVSNPVIVCDGSENASYLVMLVVSIVLVPLGCGGGRCVAVRGVAMRCDAMRCVALRRVARLADAGSAALAVQPEPRWLSSDLRDVPLPLVGRCMCQHCVGARVLAREGGL